MIYLLNLVGEDSKFSPGWRVTIEKDPATDEKHYSVNLYTKDQEKSDRIEIAIDPDDYMDLTDAHGIARGVQSKIVSNKIDNDTYEAILAKADNPIEDTNILIFNMEADIGTKITNVVFDNFLAVYVNISEEDHKEVATMVLAGVDNTRGSSVSIFHGYPGGRSLTESRAMIRPLIPNPSTRIDLSNEIHYIEDGIVVQDLVIPRFDLSKVARDNN